MKTVTPLFILFIAVLCSKSADTRPEFQVQAAGGLNMRSAPDSTSEKVLLIPDGGIVRMLEEDSKFTEISGKSGRWSKVEYQGKTGWVFGGFLTPARNSVAVSGTCPLDNRTELYSRQELAKVPETSLLNGNLNRMDPFPARTRAASFHPIDQTGKYTKELIAPDFA